MATGPSVNPFVRDARPTGLWRWLPGLSVLRAYRRSWLARDIGAGLVLTSVLVPVGMGYAEAAGLPAINGLYATIVPLVAYALFGPSRILVLGPDSALAGLIAATVLPLAAGDAVRATGLASALAVLSGALCVAAGIAKLGFVTDLLSKPIRYGYLNGIALTVLVGQLPKVLGFDVGGATLLAEARGLVSGVADGRANPAACLVGSGSLLLILVFRRWMPRVPAVLVAVVAAILAARLFDLPARTGLSVVGAMPQGLPAFALPAVSASDIGALLAGAVAVALVSFADMSVLSRTFALRNRYDADPNQELVALGAANLASGLFHGFSVSSSASRTPVAETAGARTQLAGVVGALCVGLLLVYAPALLANLPHAALAAVVIAACLSLVEVAGVRRLYRLRPGEFALSMVCFLGVALVGVVQGIFISVGLALMALVWRAWHPYDAVLGRVDGLKGYHDISRHPEARRIPGLVLFRWDAPLFFANAEVFHDHVRAAIAGAPTRTRWVVVAAEPVTDVDLTAADVLLDLDEDLRREGIELCFAEMKGPVKDRLKRYGLFDQIGTESFFPTVGEAVDRYLEATGVAWTDWDEVAGPRQDQAPGA
jgi:high affinity sulfate transporter 1